MFYDIIQIVGGIIISVGYLPQIIQILKTRSVQDLNLNTYAMIFLGICLMEIYAINLVLSGSGHAFLITNTLALLLSGAVTLLILYFR